MTDKILYKQQTLTFCFTRFSSKDGTVTGHGFWQSKISNVFKSGLALQKEGVSGNGFENRITPSGQLILVFHISPQCDWTFRNATRGIEETDYPGTPLISTCGNSDFMVLGWGAPAAKDLTAPLPTDKLLVIWDSNQNTDLFNYSLALTEPDGSRSTNRVWGHELDPQIQNNGSGGAM